MNKINGSIIQKDLVSILTPCYNGEKLIPRLLDSVLSQDYHSIEMIVVDDGSQDKSREVIKSYIIKFEQKGYSLTYIYQDNAGQAAAINRGLPLLTGEYITWPDCDDFYNDSSAISTFVKNLAETDDSVGLARAEGISLNEKSLLPLTSYEMKSLGTTFDSLIKGNWCWPPIHYMVKAACINDMIPNRHIYDADRPQNIQMFLPLVYKYKCQEINTPLVNVVIRCNSDSHRSKCLEQQMQEYDGLLRIYLNTLETISMPTQEKKQYKKIITSYWLNEKLHICMQSGKTKEANKVYSFMRKNALKIDKKKLIKLLFLNMSPRLLLCMNIIHSKF